MNNSVVIPILWGLVLLGPLLWADEIHTAAQSGDLAKVQALIEKDPSLLTLKGRRDRQPIHWAVQGGHLNIVKYLQSKGADVNAVCKYLGKPLDAAIEGGNADIIAFLKSKGATASPLIFTNANHGPDVRRLSFTWGMLSNITACGGPDGQLIVDSGFYKPAIGDIRAALKGLGKESLVYVVNTHTHWDHVQGNELAVLPQQVINAQKLADGSLDSLVKRAPEPLKGTGGNHLPAPYLLPFNGQEIQLIPYPGLHSEQDLMIYFPKSRVLCMGDLLLSQSCPALSQVAEYMALLDKVLAVFPLGTTFISGHGPDLDYSGLRKYRNDLWKMVEKVHIAYKTGLSVQQMINTDLLKEFKSDYAQLDWLGPDFWIRVVVDQLSSGALNLSGSTPLGLSNAPQAVTPFLPGQINTDQHELVLRFLPGHEELILMRSDADFNTISLRYVFYS